MEQHIQYTRFWSFGSGHRSCECAEVVSVVDGLSLQVCANSPVDSHSAGIAELLNKDGKSKGFVPVTVAGVQHTKRHKQLHCELGGDFAPIFANPSVSAEIRQGKVEWCLPNEMIQFAVAAGALVDRKDQRYVVCPDCGEQPTISRGCPICSSTETKKDTLLHHFRCAAIMPQSEFKDGDIFRCPKCHTSDLLIGVDFEVVRGRDTCRGCGHRMDETQLLGSCGGCHTFFPMDSAPNVCLPNYRVNRANWTQVFPIPTDRFEETLVPVAEPSMAL